MYWKALAIDPTTGSKVKYSWLHCDVDGGDDEQDELKADETRFSPMASSGLYDRAQFADLTNSSDDGESDSGETKACKLMPLLPRPQRSQEVLGDSPDEDNDIAL